MPGEKLVKPNRRDKCLAREILGNEGGGFAPQQSTAKILKRPAKLDPTLTARASECTPKKRKVVDKKTNNIEEDAFFENIDGEVSKVATDEEKKYIDDQMKKLRDNVFKYTTLNRSLVLAEMTPFFSPEECSTDSIFSAILKYCSETDVGLWKHIFNVKQNEQEEIKKVGSFYAIQFKGKRPDKVQPCKAGRWLSPKFRKEPVQMLFSALLQKLYEAKKSGELEFRDTEMKRDLGDELLRDAAQHHKLSPFGPIWLSQRFALTPNVDGDPSLWPGASLLDIDTESSAARTFCLLQYREQKSEPEELNTKLKRLRQNIMNIDNWRRLADIAEEENQQLKLEYEIIKQKVNQKSLAEAMYTKLELELGLEITKQFVQFLKKNEPKEPVINVFQCYKEVLNSMNKDLYD